MLIFTKSPFLTIKKVFNLSNKIQHHCILNKTVNSCIHIKSFLQGKFFFAKMISMQKIKLLLSSKLTLFICGMASCLAFAPWFIFPVLWLGLALLSARNDQATHKQVFANTFWFGAGLGVTGMNWLAYTMTLEGSNYTWLVPIIWVFFGIVFGLYYAIPAYLASFNKPGIPRWLAFSGWFGVFEWIRGWAFSGFPWNVVGNIWNNNLPILQTVSVIGVYGLGMLTVLIFTTPYFGRKIKPTICALVALSILYVLGAWRLYEAPNDSVWGVRLRVVQPNIPCSLKWDPKQAENNINKMIRLSKENNATITHIIWPEAAFAFLINYDHQDRLQLMPAMRQGSVLITGAMRAVDNEARTVANSLVVLDDLTKIRAFYDKAHLVPFGEYTPLRGILPLDKFVPFESDIIAGPGPHTIPIYKALPAAPMVCYEAIFSGEVVDKKERPAWLINVTNDGWYGISAGPYHHFAMAQTRAVEEGLPLVRSANTGISAVVDGYGRIITKLDLGLEGVIDANLPKALSPTTFSIYGNKVPLLLALLFICFAYFKQKSA